MVDGARCSWAAIDLSEMPMASPREISSRSSRLRNRRDRRLGTGRMPPCGFKCVPFQSVISTHASKRSAGVSKPSDLRGRPLSCRATSSKRSTPASKSKSTSTIGLAPAPSQTNLTKPPSKQDQLAALLVRDEGASLDQMVLATGWLPHTTRAALTGLKKKGYVISSNKIDGLRTYRAVAPQ